MFKNLLRLGWRNLKKEKLASGMNLVGLSVAIAVCLTVFTFVKIFVTVDQFHEKGDNIFLVQSVIERDEQRSTWAKTPMPLGPALASQSQGIKNAVRFHRGSGKVQFDDKVFVEGVWFADPQFLNVFSFDLKLGNPDDLHRKDAIILSSETAERIFGDENPLGKPLTITLNNRDVHRFVVKGVAAPFNQAASFEFSLITQLDNLWAAIDEKEDQWDFFTTATFVEVEHPAVLEEIKAGMSQYIAPQNAATEDWQVQSFRFENLKTMSKNRENVRARFYGGQNIAGLVVLLLIAGFIFTLACVNYTNIAIASSARRSKEIGMRKVLGGKRSQLIAQFLGENVIVCFGALVTGVLLANYFLLPSFNQLFEGPNLYLDLSNSVSTWLMLGSLLVLTSVISGAYPAMYISSFQTASIFRSSSRIKRRNIFMRILLTFQFVLTLITISASLILRSNNVYLSQLDWGYAKEGVYVLELEQPEQYAPMRDFLLQQPDVQKIAGSQGHITGNGFSVGAVKHEGKAKDALNLNVGFDYLEALDIHKKEGRFFDESYGTDKDEAVVVNEQFVMMMGWEEPVGKIITFENNDYRVIGVTENFITQHFTNLVRPIFMLLSPEETYRNIIIRFNTDEPRNLVTATTAEWKRVFPAAVFNGYFQANVFVRNENEDQNVVLVFSFAASMALLISCMGLFGLASQFLNRRMREIGVRKVLGATMSNLFRVINKGFLLQLACASIIAAPASYFLMNLLLDNVYAQHMTLGISQIIISCLVVVVTTVTTITFVMRRAYSLPVTEVLREE